MSFILPDDPAAREAGSGTPAVLVIDGDNGQSRSALAAVRALARARYRVVVATPARWSLAAASAASSGRIVIPPSGEEGHAEAVRAELAGSGCQVALPTSDASLIALDACGRQFLDKHDLAERAVPVGLGSVPDEVFATGEALVAAAPGLRFPCVYKPDDRILPVGRANSPDDLRKLYALDSRVMIQPFLDGEMHAVAGLVWRGVLVLAVHQHYARTWPTPCGTASAAVTVAPDQDLEDRLTALFEGYDGIFQAQFIGSHLIDLNPRVYGSLPLAVAAGVNLPAALCDLLAGRRVESARGRAGVHYRWIEGDLRHLAQRVRRREISVRGLGEALRPRAGTAHSVFAMRDLGPGLARGRYAFGRRGRR